MLDPGVDWVVRLTALGQIVGLSPDARRAADALVKGLDDEHCQVRHLAARGMEAAGVVNARQLAEIIGARRIETMGLSGKDLHALVLIKRLHGSDPADVQGAAKTMLRYEGEQGAIWRKLAETLTFNPDEFSDSSMMPLSEEVLVYRLVTSRNDLLRIEYAYELSVRHADWAGPLLESVEKDFSQDEALRNACREAAQRL